MCAILGETGLDVCFGVRAQIGLVDMLRKEYGIVPAGMLGHSAGEIPCGYADGCLTREQTILIAYHRGAPSTCSFFLTLRAEDGPCSWARAALPVRLGACPKRVLLPMVGKVIDANCKPNVDRIFTFLDDL